MAIITLFGSTFCHADEINKKVSDKLKYEILSDDTLMKETALRFSTTVDKINRAMYGTPSFLNTITHEKERSVIFLKATFADIIKDKSLGYCGYAGLLFPKNITHILKVYIIANHEYRIKNAIKEKNINEREAANLIRKNDKDCIRWAHYILGEAPWEKSLHDIVIPMHSTTIDDAVSIICENVQKNALKVNPQSLQALEDFALASKINIALIEKRYNVDVLSDKGNITLLLKKYVIRLEHYKDEMTKIIKDIPGVKTIEAKFNPNINPPTITRSIDSEIPSKILLVDDEVEFIHTLSERLKTRSMESSVVYDGEEALSVVEEEEPDVMVLDLKMPGINGIEVLRKVKETHPNVEIIILTGHGSQKEREIAEELGAFAYFEKPVDIEILTKAMQDAYKKISGKKASKGDV